ncbi:unnamed protein product, partial [Polarella glacialis]
GESGSAASRRQSVGQASRATPRVALPTSARGAAVSQVEKRRPWRGPGPAPLAESEAASARNASGDGSATAPIRRAAPLSSRKATAAPVGLGARGSSAPKARLGSARGSEPDEATLRVQIARMRQALDGKHVSIEQALAEVSLHRSQMEESKARHEAEMPGFQRTVRELAAENRQLQAAACGRWDWARRLQAAVRSQEQHLEAQSEELLESQQRLERENTRLRKAASALRARLLGWEQTRRKLSTAPRDERPRSQDGRRYRSVSPMPSQRTDGFAAWPEGTFGLTAEERRQPIYQVSAIPKSTGSSSSPSSWDTPAPSTPASACGVPAVASVDQAFSPPQRAVGRASWSRIAEYAGASPLPHAAGSGAPGRTGRPQGLPALTLPLRGQTPPESPPSTPSSPAMAAAWAAAMGRIDGGSAAGSAISVEHFGSELRAAEQRTLEAQAVLARAQAELLALTAAMAAAATADRGQEYRTRTSSFETHEEGEESAEATSVSAATPVSGRSRQRCSSGTAAGLLTARSTSPDSLGARARGAIGQAANAPSQQAEAVEDDDMRADGGSSCGEASPGSAPEAAPWDSACSTAAAEPSPRAFVSERPSKCSSAKITHSWPAI